jgi:hypothetical protein
MEICGIIDGPISAEVVVEGVDNMLAQAVTSPPGIRT